MTFLSNQQESSRTTGAGFQSTPVFTGTWARSKGLVRKWTPSRVAGRPESRNARLFPRRCGGQAEPWWSQGGPGAQGSVLGVQLLGEEGLFLSQTFR